MLHGTIVAESRSGAVRITETRYAGEVVLAHHCHADPYVSILVEGDYTEVRGGAPQRCNSGTVIVHHRGEEHADYFPQSGRCLNVELLDRSHPAHGALSRKDDSATSCRLQAAAHHLARVHATGKNNASELEPAIDELLESIAASNHSATHPAPHWLQRALNECIWTDAGTLEQIAREVGIHPTHFSRAFRYHMGLTPNEYRRKSRVGAASQLLLDSHTGLADVAQATGFHDQSHLTHAFVAVAGMPPARYRRIFRR
jgi:AraC family transcriptional regulator